MSTTLRKSEHFVAISSPEADRVSASGQEPGQGGTPGTSAENGDTSKFGLLRDHLIVNYLEYFLLAGNGTISATGLGLGQSRVSLSHPLLESHGAGIENTYTR